SFLRRAAIMLLMFFKALNAGIDALKIPQQDAPQADLDRAQAGMDEANRGIKAALDQISNIEAKQGLQLQEIDKLDFLADTRSIQNAARKSELLETNWTGTTTDYYKEKAMFDASQSIFKDLNSMSLFGNR
ncbi:flagellar hook-associated protein FlgL, partial [Providencia vermicola]|nr:flagellar hook-associated protein FlgL [Providencia vermicola]